MRPNKIRKLLNSWIPRTAAGIFRGEYRRRLRRPLETGFWPTTLHVGTHQSLPVEDVSCDASDGVAKIVFVYRCRRLFTTQIDILNSSYSTTRFAFTYAWWSAFGFSRHVKQNAVVAEEMELIDQAKVLHC